MKKKENNWTFRGRFPRPKTTRKRPPLRARRDQVNICLAFWIPFNFLLFSRQDWPTPNLPFCWPFNLRTTFWMSRAIRGRSWWGSNWGEERRELVVNWPLCGYFRVDACVKSTWAASVVTKSPNLVTNLSPNLVFNSESRDFEREQRPQASRSKMFFLSPFFQGQLRVGTQIRR